MNVEDQTCNGCARAVRNCECVRRPTTHACCNPVCNWEGVTDRMLTTVGPLCPDCGEVTEPVPDSAIVSGSLMDELAHRDAAKDPVIGYDMGDRCSDAVAARGYMKDGVLHITEMERTPYKDPAYATGYARHVMHECHQLPLGLVGGHGAIGGHGGAGGDCVTYSGPGFVGGSVGGGGAAPVSYTSRFGNALRYIRKS